MTFYLYNFAKKFIFSRTLVIRAKGYYIASLNLIQLLYFQTKKIPLQSYTILVWLLLIKQLLIHSIKLMTSTKTLAYFELYLLCTYL